MDAEPEFMPISMLNQLEYCERRFYLMYVLGEMEVNAHVLQGVVQHEHAHRPDTDREDQKVTLRRVYTWSDEFHISGFVDLVEEENGVIFPVEYKKGRMGKWLNDHIQLTAQAICLEERSGKVVEKGAIFYFGSRHREEVNFTAKLRLETRAAIERAFKATTGRMPPILENFNKCLDCSLEPICMPREVKIIMEAR